MTQEYNCYANTLLKKKKIGESIYSALKQSVNSIHNITLTQPIIK